MKKKPPKVFFKKNQNFKKSKIQKFKKSKNQKFDYLINQSSLDFMLVVFAFF